MRDHVAGFSALNRTENDGFSYARVSNPTVTQLADKLAALERAISGASVTESS